MMLGSFIITYFNYSEPSKMLFDGPFSTIDKAQARYEELKALEPCLSRIYINRLMYQPFNPRLY